MLLELKSGGIIDIRSENDYTSGCSTCDYGSTYSQYYDVIMVNNTLKIEVKQGYDYALSEGIMMKILLNNLDEIKTMTEQEFAKWLVDKVKDALGFYFDGRYSYYINEN